MSETAVAVYDRDYLDYVDKMKRARIAYRRGYEFYHDGIPDFALTMREKYVDDPSARWGFRRAYKTTELRSLEKEGPMPMDLRAFEIAMRFNPPKYTFPNLIGTSLRHKRISVEEARAWLSERNLDHHLQFGPKGAS